VLANHPLQLNSLLIADYSSKDELLILPKEKQMMSVRTIRLGLSLVGGFTNWECSLKMRKTYSEVRIVTYARSNPKRRIRILSASPETQRDEHSQQLTRKQIN
jgi:hypothetical protein